MHEINIVPYVDVMLVLLVIFMVTAPLITPAVIDLPTVDKASAPRVVPLEVYVKVDRSLVKAMRGKDAELSVLVGGDRNARYEAVLQVMDELRKHGVQKVGLQVKVAQ